MSKVYVLTTTPEDMNNEDYRQPIIDLVHNLHLGNDNGNDEPSFKVETVNLPKDLEEEWLTNCESTAYFEFIDNKIIQIKELENHND